ncbi:MAG: PilT/PilU family type 4a pilus ATPase [Deltaproteobacteria bacterium]|nr:PilT/PilU family type 4a pilus ATPase [Deltaproteobacteria bacterium]MBW2595075.1 PilT/PilU family type 4a pilus ATPase [Deltaproteobacteria bacterium]MBW2649436.1 PilT/PilU family type 4a pilus ATPase [Deltaproteobacteria bacterium]
MRKQEIDYILNRMLDSHGDISDLNITVGKPFQVETSGALTTIEMDFSPSEITPFQAEMLALNLINRDRNLMRTLVEDGSCDASYELHGKARFRVNIFSRGDTYSTVLRKLEDKVPTCEGLNLPKVLYEIPEEKNGLVLFAGATGTGKTTSLAAVLNEINEKRPVHVITLEDPVEYKHPHKKATFNQRELGADFPSFASGLRAALRQAPKVILVGEMRDRETMEIGLGAAETGHLVFSSLHTVNAGQTINRIIGMFPQEEETQIRARLADTIRWVICQRLLPRVGGGRVAAFEILKTNLRIKDTILNGEKEGKTFPEIIEAGHAFGMVTFDQYIIGLYQDGAITEETALSYATTKGVVGRGIDSIKSEKGETTTEIENLEVEW